MRILTKCKNVFLLSKLKKVFKKALILTDNNLDNICVGLTFVDGKKIQELNKEHRNVDRVTDVLSFPMLDMRVGDKIFDKASEIDRITGEIFLGDIVICKDKVFSQAKEFGHSKRKELVYLALHSFLHLLGYDHMTKKEEKEMFSLAEKVLGYGREI